MSSSTKLFFIPQSTSAQIAAAIPTEPGTQVYDINKGEVVFTNDGTNFEKMASSADLAGYLPLTGGSLSGPLDMGANDITSVVNLGVDNIQMVGGNINCDTQQINNVGDPIVSTDAATKNYVDTAGGNYLPTAGGTMTGSIVFNVGGDSLHGNATYPFDIRCDNVANIYIATGAPYVYMQTQFTATGINVFSQLISNLLDPAAPQDAATKNYVDTTAASFISISVVTGTVFNMVDVSVINRIILQNTSPCTLTLPVSMTVGHSFEIVGRGIQGWIIEQNAGQGITIGTSSTTNGVSGSLSSTHNTDSLILTCSNTNTHFTGYGVQGNPDFV